MNNCKFKILAIVILILSLSCSNQQNEKEEVAQPKGKLFIIGGGKRPVEMLQSLVTLSGVDTNGYIIVLPMASEMTDTAIFYGKKQFLELGLSNIFALNFRSEKDMTKEKLDSLKNAKLIYISGGDQNKFMNIVANSPVFDAINYAYQNGSVIAGTSAGAAVMSKKMITGEQHKHPEYTGNFRTIEANNIEISNGLGLIDNVIIDQHFIKRMRMNRLISVCIENPEEICIGIDESTAIYVDRNKVTVYGAGQAIVLKNKSADTKSVNGLLGGKGLELSVFLPGDIFYLILDTCNLMDQ